MAMVNGVTSSGFGWAKPVWVSAGVERDAMDTPVRVFEFVRINRVVSRTVVGAFKRQRVYKGLKANGIRVRMRMSNLGAPDYIGCCFDRDRGWNPADRDDLGPISKTISKRGLCKDSRDAGCGCAKMYLEKG